MHLTQYVNQNDSKCMYLFCYKMSAILYRGHDNSSKINNGLKKKEKMKLAIVIKSEFLIK